MSAAQMSSASGTHVFEVIYYSVERYLDAGHYIFSDTFDVGGYAWTIRFHPGGDATETDSGEYAAVTLTTCLELMTKNAVVAASYDMALIDIPTGARWIGAKSVKAAFDTRSADGFWRWHLSRFRKRSELEASPFLRDDRLAIECTLTVTSGTRATDVVDTMHVDKLDDLRDKAAIQYIQTLCSSKESDGKLVYKSHRGHITANDMRCLTIPSNVDEPTKYLSINIIDAYTAHMMLYTKGRRLLCPVSYGAMLVDKQIVDKCSKLEHLSFYQNFTRKFFDYDLVFSPLLVTNGSGTRHWILVVMCTRKMEFQVLDSGRNFQQCQSTVQSLVEGIAQMTSMARMAYPSLPNDVAAWKIREIKNAPKQTDRCSCGVYIIKYMQYCWDGSKMHPDFTQEDIHMLRNKMVSVLIFSQLNEVAEAKEDVRKIMR
ncbi:hypothetical protein EJB05_08898, partial [Eragrostis curvula]